MQKSNLTNSEISRLYTMMCESTKGMDAWDRALMAQAFMLEHNHTPHVLAALTMTVIRTLGVLCDQHKDAEGKRLYEQMKLAVDDFKTTLDEILPKKGTKYLVEQAREMFEE